jgi:hypothetical protein
MILLTHYFFFLICELAKCQSLLVNPYVMQNEGLQHEIREWKRLGKKCDIEVLEKSEKCQRTLGCTRATCLVTFVVSMCNTRDWSTADFSDSSSDEE